MPSPDLPTAACWPYEESVPLQRMLQSIVFPLNHLEEITSVPKRELKAMLTPLPQMCQIGRLPNANIGRSRERLLGFAEMTLTPSLIRRARHDLQADNYQP
jgi:hypothetical protein